MDAEVREGAWLRRASPAMLASAALVIEVANLAIRGSAAGARCRSCSPTASASI